MSLMQLTHDGSFVVVAYSRYGGPEHSFGPFDHSLAAERAAEKYSSENADPGEDVKVLPLKRLINTEKRD